MRADDTPTPLTKLIAEANSEILCAAITAKVLNGANEVIPPPPQPPIPDHLRKYHERLPWRAEEGAAPFWYWRNFGPHMWQVHERHYRLLERYSRGTRTFQESRYKRYLRAWKQAINADKCFDGRMKTPLFINDRGRIYNQFAKFAYLWTEKFLWAGREKPKDQLEVTFDEKGRPNGMQIVAPTFKATAYRAPRLSADGQVIGNPLGACRLDAIEHLARPRLKEIVVGLTDNQFVVFVLMFAGMPPIPGYPDLSVGVPMNQTDAAFCLGKTQPDIANTLKRITERFRNAGLPDPLPNRHPRVVGSASDTIITFVPDAILDLVYGEILKLRGMNLPAAPPRTMTEAQPAEAEAKLRQDFEHQQRELQRQREAEQKKILRAIGYEKNFRIRKISQLHNQHKFNRYAKSNRRRWK